MSVDHTFDFFFLNGDANRDGTVNLRDFNTLAARFGMVLPAPAAGRSPFVDSSIRSTRDDEPMEVL